MLCIYIRSLSFIMARRLLKSKCLLRPPTNTQFTNTLIVWCSFRKTIIIKSSMHNHIVYVKWFHFHVTLICCFPRCRGLSHPLNTQTRSFLIAYSTPYNNVIITLWKSPNNGSSFCHAILILHTIIYNVLAWCYTHTT